MGDHIRPIPAATTSERPARRALVIDRDEASRSSVAALLTAAGFEITHPSAGPAADVVVIRLDGTDDLATLAELTADGTAAVVVLADGAATDLVAGARDAGAQAFLPVAPAATVLVPAVVLAIARHAETAALRAEVATARRRLETRKLIDRAKGLLMTHRGLSEPEAFRWIQRTAMNRRKSSASVAAQIIAEHERSAVPAAS